ncbi:MAG: bifunctional folylpolyglutamate synthase/dihydrofolate synthase [Flavobacteriales bacterium]|nr:bifunctional folylpolyglutamate synthase/dihydrofolate synthase [Flavobacteriales bacterium]
MDYYETLEYLFTQLPIFQRQGPAAYKADLSNTHKILDLLDHPEKGLKCVHIAGTNGKGSVAHMIAAVLQSQGYKTGLYTSPHLKDFRERIRINGKMIDQDAVVEFVEANKMNWKPISPSFFEITVGMAFWHFQQQEVDIAVIETGLGGRLDSSNVVEPEISIITNIGLDHTQFLGDTIEEIAAEKGGIIKSNTPLVLGKMRDEARNVLLNMAEKLGSEVTDSNEIELEPPESDLIGAFQYENRKTAMLALKALKSRGWELDFEHVVSGLGNVVKLTGMQGRWQQLGEDPLIIADGAHNPDGLRVVIAELQRVRKGELHIVLGMVGDKPIEAALRMFPTDANYYFCKANIPRGMPADALRQQAFGVGLKGEDYPSVKRAFEAARLYSSKGDTIFIGGSFFTVAEVL